MIDTRVEAKELAGLLWEGEEPPPEVSDTMMMQQSFG